MQSVTNIQKRPSGPLVKAFTTIGMDEKQMLRKKFDIAYFVATEKMAFTKYPRICELEKRHDVELGVSYLNMEAGKTFCHYILHSTSGKL